MVKALRQAGENAESAIADLAATGRYSGGDPNLWMAGIAKDLRRDTRSVEQGPLLDASIIGAIRKGEGGADRVV